TTADIHDQPGHIFEVFGYVFKIDASFEAMAGFRAEPVAARAAHNGFRPPECAFQINIGGVQCDCRGFPTHDAGHALHRVAGSDDANVGLQLHNLATKKLELLAITRPTNSEATLHTLSIEDVRGPPQFQHDEVGNIHECRNGALPGSFQLLLHPFRRLRFSVNTANNAPGKAAT